MSPGDRSEPVWMSLIVRGRPLLRAASCMRDRDSQKQTNH